MSRDSTAPRRGYSGLLRNREYVGLLLSDLISLVGSQLSRVALVVLVYERTNSPLLSAATYAATFLPVVIGAPLLGGLADRLPRRQVLIAADLVRAALFAVMAIHGMPLWVLLGLLLIAVTVEAPANSARGPLMREILVDDEGYQLGTSLDEAIYQGGQIIGFAVAGGLLVLLTPSTALLLDAASFVVSALVIRLLVRHRPAADTEAGDEEAPSERVESRFTKRMRQGLRDARLGFAVAMAPACRRPLLLTWAGVSLSIAPEALAVPWAAQLGAGPLGYGLIFAASPAGSVVGMLLVGRVSVPVGQRLLVPLTVVALLPLLFAPGAMYLSLALTLAFVSGVGTTYSMLARVAFVSAVDDAHRGRAFGVAAAGVTAGQGLGIALAGALASLTDPAMSIALCASIGLLLVTVVVATTPRPGLPEDPDAVDQSPSALVGEDPIAATPWPGPAGLPPAAPRTSDDDAGPPAGARPAL